MFDQPLCLVCLYKYLCAHGMYVRQLYVPEYIGADARLVLLYDLYVWEDPSQDKHVRTYRDRYQVEYEPPNNPPPCPPTLHASE